VGQILWAHLQFLRGTPAKRAILIVLVQGFSSHELQQRGRSCGEFQALAGNGGVLKVGVRSNREQLLFPEYSCGGSIGFSVCGMVNVPEFLSKPAKLNSDHAAIEMFPSDERDVASLVLFGD
jgi:hypothetical protein